jgi:hypothetical protein
VGIGQGEGDGVDEWPVNVEECQGVRVIYSSARREANEHERRQRSRFGYVPVERGGGRGGGRRRRRITRMRVAIGIRAIDAGRLAYAECEKSFSP